MQILLPEAVITGKKFHILYSIILLGYLLGIHDGYIALWKDASDQPGEVFPYSAELLPDAERQRLQKGIRLETHEELMIFLENYLS